MNSTANQQKAVRLRRKTSEQAVETHVGITTDVKKKRGLHRRVPKRLLCAKKREVCIRYKPSISSLKPPASNPSMETPGERDAHFTRPRTSRCKPLNSWQTTAFFTHADANRDFFDTNVRAHITHGERADRASQQPDRCQGKSSSAKPARCRDAKTDDVILRKQAQAKAPGTGRTSPTAKTLRPPASP